MLTNWSTSGLFVLNASFWLSSLSQLKIASISIISMGVVREFIAVRTRFLPFRCNPLYHFTALSPTIMPIKCWGLWESVLSADRKADTGQNVSNKQLTPVFYGQAAYIYVISNPVRFTKSIKGEFTWSLNLIFPTR